MPDFPTVPVPTKEPEALLESVIALKQVVDMLTGQDNADRFAPHVFVQHDQPTAYHTGDLWLCEAGSFSLNIWNGDRWIKITDVAASTTRDQPDLLLHQFRRPR